MRTNKKVMTGALLLFMMMAANFQNALNDYGIRSNAFMNGVIASGSNGSGTQIDCNENGGNAFYFCSLAPDPQNCVLYRSLNASGSAEWGEGKPSGKLGIDFEQTTGAKNICADEGDGCSLFTCMQVNPPLPQ